MLSPYGNYFVDDSLIIEVGALLKVHPKFRNYVKFASAK